MKLKICIALFLICAAVPLSAAEGKVGFCSLKTSIEKSKYGKQEKASFEALKKQLTENLEKMDKELAELAQKLEDKNFVESLSPAAQEELQKKLQTLSQEFVRSQNQAYQLLNQANFKMLQELQAKLCKAAERVREKKKLDYILNDDAAFAFAPSLDLSDDIIREMDLKFDEENSEKP